MSGRRRLLLIAYNYPPHREVGSHRARAFARHLPQFGWHSVVVTHQPEAAMADPTIDDGIAEGVEILRTPPGEVGWRLHKYLGTRVQGLRNSAGSGTSRRFGFLRSLVHTWLYVPDGRIAWFQDAIACGLTAARRAPVHAILSSFSPATAHLVACTLSRRLGVPWIADYRDSWTADPLTPYASRIRHKVDCLLEALLLSKCAAVTAATEQLVAELRRLTADRIPVRLVRNGYDPEDFAGLRRHAQSRWTLTHVGRFYGMSRDPTPLFRALRHMLDEGRLQPGEMQVRVVGDIEPPVFELAQQFHLEELVHFTGPLAHRDALTEEISADALLFLLGDYPAAGGLLSSKIFEYLGAGRPILAIAPMASEAARLIEETRAGIVAPPNSGEKIEQALRQLMTGTCTSSLVGLREKYQRREATRELAKLLAELTS